MKIRIKGNSVRFRLTKTEVQTLCEKGMVREKTDFDESHFIYAVKSSEKHESISASFLNQGIVLFVPKNSIKDWYENNQIGFYHNQILNNGSLLDIKLEKDFVCMDDTIEDQSDNYPNPKMSNT